MADAPTHQIMVVNRETYDLKQISAHGEAEAQAAFESLSSLFAATPNDVHKVPVPTATGFCASQIETSKGTVAKPAQKRAQPAPTIAAPNGASEDDPDPEVAYGRWV